MTGSSNDFHYWQRPAFKLLSRVQLGHIYSAALEVLERVGGEFHDPQAVSILADAGARVQDYRRVRIPATLVNDALQKAPRRIVVCNRDGRRQMFLEGRNTYFGPGSDTPWTLDPISDERRPAVLEDVARTARVVDALPGLDFSMCFGKIPETAVLGQRWLHRFQHPRPAGGFRSRPQTHAVGPGR
jgi:trimethylamine--corrinoid protein Co-methyltransferase